MSHWPFNQLSSPLAQLGTFQHLLSLLPFPEISELRKLSTQTWQNWLSTLNRESLGYLCARPTIYITSAGLHLGHSPMTNQAQQGRHGPSHRATAQPWWCVSALCAVPVGSFKNDWCPDPTSDQLNHNAKQGGPGISICQYSHMLQGLGTPGLSTASGDDESCLFNCTSTMYLVLCWRKSVVFQKQPLFSGSIRVASGIRATHGG